MSLDLLVLGAGISGLMAAHQAQRLHPEWRIELIDKGVQVGGRLATRRLGDSPHAALVDHGAQFFTLGPSSLLNEVVEEAIQAGWIREWQCRSDDQATTYVCINGMSALAKHLASRFVVHLSKRVVTIHPQSGDVWAVTDEDGFVYHAKRLVITFPLPQSLMLLAASDIPLPSALPVDLTQISYHHCLAVLGQATRSDDFGCNGALAIENGSDITWIASNHQKGISSKPAYTVHAAPNFSEQHYNEPDEKVLEKLMPVIEATIGQSLESPQVKRWRYSLVKDDPHIHGFFAQAPYCVISDTPFLALCGDAFTTGRVASAAWSGCQVIEQCLA